MAEILLKGNISLHEGDVVLLKSPEECEHASTPFYISAMKPWTEKEQTIDIIERLNQNCITFSIKDCPFTWTTEAIAEIIYPKLNDLNIATNSLIF